MSLLKRTYMLLLVFSILFSWAGLARAGDEGVQLQGSESVDQVIRANIGVVEGVQVDPTHPCKFEVTETYTDRFLLMLTLDAPSRMIGAHFSGDSRFFWFDATAHTITFERTAIGRPNVIYTYDPVTLKVVSIEEEGQETCKIKSENL